MNYDELTNVLRHLREYAKVAKQAEREDLKYTIEVVQDEADKIRPTTA